MDAIKVAASTYLNSAPLIYGFAKGSLRSRCHLLGDAAPAKCADMLGNRLVDVALIPSIEYQRLCNVLIVPAISVASKFSVKSVLLFSKVPIEQIQTLALDLSSRTSATLVRILLEHIYKLKPVYKQQIPNLEQMLECSDAALIIGDPAMVAASDSKHQYYIYDMAKEWREMTSLPFVFALWAVTADLPRERRNKVVDYCTISKAEGLSARSQIAQDYSNQLQLPLESLQSYLLENISYELDEENLA
ncbi:MAG: menaquinone biosynthesis protein, partial [Blastocatellia bacterium]|nr:menaquinone biosynthesis protein [Blastocatellia bacterium]